MKRYVAVALALLISSTASARTWFVDRDNTSGVEDGISWDTAFTNINRAVLSAFNDGGGDVWVAAATYDEVRIEQRDGAVQLFPGVRIFGGFAGNEISFDERPEDPKENPTVISGIASDGLEAFARHVLVAENIFTSEDARAVVDGFTIIGGRGLLAGGSGNSNSFGAGIKIRNANPLIRNCIFSNSAWFGASVWMTGETDATFENCVFVESRSLIRTQCPDGAPDLVVGGGGAIFTDTATALADFHGCVFTRNIGGAIRTASSIYVTNSYFVGNRDLFDCRRPPAPDATGIMIDGGVPVIENTVFIGNADLLPGAAVASFGDASAGFTLINSTFRKNTGLPSGVFLGGSTLATMVNSIVWEDNAIGVNQFGPPPDANKGAGVRTKALADFTYSNIFRGFPGARNLNLDPAFVRTVRGNWERSEAFRDIATVVLTDVDANFTPGQHVGKAIDLGSSFGYIHANTQTTLSIFALTFNLEGIFEFDDPDTDSDDGQILYVNNFPDRVVFEPFPQTGNYEIVDYHLRGDSAMIDAGTPLVVPGLDNDGDAVFNAPDMGADQYNALTADADIDGVVDASDGDADGDGIPNSSDIAPFDGTPSITPTVRDVTLPGIPLTVDLTEHEFDPEDIDRLVIALPEDLPPNFDSRDTIPLRWTISDFDPSIFASQIEPLTDEWIITPVGFGTTPVTLTLTDSAGQTHTQTMSVTVFNAPPEIGDVPDVTFFEDSESEPVEIAELVSDINNSLLTLSIIDSAHISGQLLGDGTAVFTAAPNYYGEETLMVRVTDPEAASVESPVFVRVLPVNDAPTIAPPIPDMMMHDDKHAMTLSDHEHDVEDSGADLTWSVSEVDADLFDVTLNPDTDELIVERAGLTEGTDDIVLTLRDSGGLSTSQVVTVTIPTTYSLDVTVVPRGSGTVELTPDADRYLAGTIVTLNAEPRAGYRFVHWTGDLGGTQALKTLDIAGPRNVMAVFEEVVGPPPPPPEDRGDDAGAGDMEGEEDREGDGESTANGGGPDCAGGSLGSRNGGAADAVVMLFALGALVIFTRGGALRRGT